MKNLFELSEEEKNNIKERIKNRMKTLHAKCD